MSRNLKNGAIVPLSVAAMGTNLSGLEWNSTAPRSTNNLANFNNYSNYAVNTTDFFKFLYDQGVQKVRVPVEWTILQPTLARTGNSRACLPPYTRNPGDLHSEVVSIIQRYLTAAAQYNIKVVIDIHNYGSYVDFNYQSTGYFTGYAVTTNGKYVGSSTAGLTRTVTFNNSSTLITSTSSTVVNINEPVTFTTTGSLPTNITAGTVYYVVTAINTTAGAIATSPGGTPITFASASTGTTTLAQPASLTTLSFKNGTLLASDLADLCTRMIAAFDSYSSLEGYGLMNEVELNQGEPDSFWVPIAQTSVNAIRTAGSTKKIFVDGPYNNVAVNGNYNSSMFQTITDSANNIFREIHTYPDAIRSGTIFDWMYDRQYGLVVDFAPVTGNLTIGTTPFVSLSALRATYPATNYPGEVAMVGSAVYTSNGYVWSISSNYQGPFANATVLASTITPASNLEYTYALVGTAYPYAIYSINSGGQWVANSGNVGSIGAIRGQDLAIASSITKSLYGNPIMNGEYGVPVTNDKYITISMDLVSRLRQAHADVYFWGASMNPFFSAQSRIIPRLYNGQNVQIPQFALVNYGAGVEKANIVTYVNTQTNVLTIEAVGSLLSTVRISVSDGGNGTTFSSSYVDLLPGVLSSGTITFTPPIGASVTFTFTSSRTAITAPSSVTLLNYTTSGTGNALQGQTVLQNNRAAVFIAGTGTCDYSSYSNQKWFESLIPNAGMSDDRYAYDNLLASPQGRIPVVIGHNSRPAWTFMGKNYSLNEYSSLNPSATDYFTNIYNNPSLTSGITPNHMSKCSTFNSTWFMVATVDITTTTAISAGTIVNVSTPGNSWGVKASLNANNTVSLVVETNGTTVTNTASSPTTLVTGNLYTIIVTVVNGAISLYINGTLETTGAFTGPLPTATGGVAGQPVINVSSTSGIVQFSSITGTGVPANSRVLYVSGTTITTCDTNMNIQNLTANATGTYNIGVYLNDFSVGGGVLNFYTVSSLLNNARVYSASLGTGSLASSDIAGITAYFNGITTPTNTVPINSVVPAISGKSIVGSILTATSGTFTNSPTAYAYQWYRSGYPITGATTSSYTLVTADVGNTISCGVVASNANGPSRESQSNVAAPTPLTSSLVYTFEGDTVGNAPANITVANTTGALVVANTGVSTMIGNYVRDSQSTTKTGFNIYNLTNFTPTGDHSITLQYPASGHCPNILLMPQTGTTVSGYTGMLQGYLVDVNSTAVKVYKATSTGLVQLGSTSYASFIGGYIRVIAQKSNIIVAYSFDGINFTNFVAVYGDYTYTTPTGNIQLMFGNGSVPNTQYADNITLTNL